MSNGRDRSNRLAWTILVILSLIWGSSFILIKKGLYAFSPDQVGSLRIFSAAIFLIPFAITRFKNPKRKQFFLLLILGFAGSLLPAYLFAMAQTRIDSSVAGVLNALTPLWVLLVGSIFFLQKMNVRISVGMFIGFVGTVILVLGNSGTWTAVNLYGLFVVGATICYGINVNIIKYKMAKLSSVTITSISIVLVGPLALVHLFTFTDFVYRVQNHPNALTSLASIVFLGVVGTAVALVLFNKLVQITTPIFASTVTYLIPIVALGWGIMDGEKLVIQQFSGMALILVGVFIAHRIKLKSNKQ